MTNNSDQEVNLRQYECTNKIDIHFKNIFYSAKTGVIRRKEKNILKGVSGEFKSGKFTAILGTSGAGKSTLLSVLTGFVTLGVEGEIFDNEELRDPKEFKKQCSYIMQDDHLQPLLTVQETMEFTASLKISSKVSHEDKQKRIEAILRNLGIYECRHVLTSKISGGQRRRLSIAVELIHNPTVMFLDEPTSGLDEVTSRQIINLLSKLAEEGKTIVCTIHQPSATILQVFDHLYCMVDGFCTYQGTVDGMLPFLEALDPPLKCPDYHNPADFLLEVCAGVYGDVCDSMVKQCLNGEVSVKSSLEDDKDKCSFTNVRNGIHASIPSFESFEDTKGTYPTSFLHQVLMIMKRTYVIISRDRQLTFSRMILHVIVGLIVGILFFQIGEDGRYTLDNMNFIFVTFLFLMYVSFCSMLLAFADELPIITREHFNGWYSVSSYLTGVTIADLPIQLIITVVYIIVSYNMTGQPLVGYRFGIFLLMCVLNSLVAQSFGMLFSSYLKLETGVIIGPVSMIPFIVFSGYFVHMKDAPSFAQFAFDLSFMRYSLEGAMQAIMGYDRGKLVCPEVAHYCHFVYPEVLLDQIGMKVDRVHLDFWVLVIHYFALKFVSYIALVHRIGGKK